MHLNVLSAKWWPFCPGGSELIVSIWDEILPVIREVAVMLCIVNKYGYDDDNTGMAM